MDAIKGLYSGFAEGDIPAATAGFAPAIIWNEAENVRYSDLNPYVGPEAVITGLFARIGEDWDGFTATPTTFLPSGDHVVVLGRYGGTSRTTGKTMDAPFAHVFTVADGKIASFQEYTDTAQVRAVMGDAWTAGSGSEGGPAETRRLADRR